MAPGCRLSLMYPGHDIPVLQLALQSRLGPPHHLQLGRAIAALREQDVLVIGSGSFTHNLGSTACARSGAPPPPDIVAFADWMHASLTGQRVDDLLDYRRKAPYAALQHPTEEHLLPLFVALGAAGEAAHATRLHASTTWGTLRMDAYQLRRLMRLFLYGTLLDAGTLALRGGSPRPTSRACQRHYPAGGAWRCAAAAILRCAAVGADCVRGAR